ncbi:putative leucine-rich repeat domain superfamily [Plasmopara halstedii]
MAPFFSRGWKVDQGPSIPFKHDLTRNPVKTEIGCESWWTGRQRRFSAIGWRYVVLMIIIFSLSSAWGLLSIVLNLAPGASANYILQAESLDHGHFWQSRKTRFSIQATAIALQAVVVIVYWHLLYLLLLQPQHRNGLTLRRQRVRNLDYKHITLFTLGKKLRGMLWKVLQFFCGVSLGDGTYRKVWNVFMEIPEVLLQILTLREHMAQGLDPSLLYVYASLMALNAFVVFILMQFRWSEAVYHHTLKDSILDAVCAVFFPALILSYSFFVFQDELKLVRIRQQYFPPHIFERKARNYVSAIKLNQFSTNFESLLIRSEWDIVIKLSFSLLACLRWTRITFVLLEKDQLFSYVSAKVAANDLTGVSKESGNCVTPLDARSSIVRNFSSKHTFSKPERQILRSVVGLLFVVYGFGCIAYTICAVRQSRTSCSSYPQCVQFSFQYFFDQTSEKCHCLAYVDRDLTPAGFETFADITETLAELSGAGKLQSIQVVNRNINGSLPDELATCHDLRHLILIHTGVNKFPSWSSTSFSRLEYLHIEGDSSELNLIELPIDFFHLMTHLHTLYLSNHANLSNLPAILGLESLESVYFGYLDSLPSLPLMENLQALQVLALQGLYRIRTLPDIEQFQDTLEMLFVQDSAVCCDGYLNGGRCNTTFKSCCENPRSKDSQSLPSLCLSMPAEEALLPSSTTLSVISRFASNVSNFCDPTQAICPHTRLEKHMRTFMDVCAGVLYRRCTSDDKGIGICFNEDMGRIQCIYSQATIEMRKAEIEAGCSCDQVEEEWLGCR